jgi:hypothetical protein
VRVYPASKAHPLHIEMWRALRQAGVPIISPCWIDWSGNEDRDSLTADDWGRHWHDCIINARAADVLLFYSAEGETACGQLVELGAALAHGVQCFVVGPHWWSVAHHRLCRIFPTLADAIAAIVALNAGGRDA